MISIGIFHMKGGVGKSALTVFLADFLSSIHEQRVLVVDLDPQGSTSKALIPEDKIDKAFKSGLSLTALLRHACNGGVTKEQVECCLLHREQTGKARKGSVPLGALSVLATHREDWRELNEEINSLERTKRWRFLDVLKDALAPVKDDFDIALLDFPGSEILFWTTMGLRATDYWLLPEIPDFFSIADIESVVELVHEAQKNSTHTIHPLGTLLNICPDRKSDTYRKARAALSALEDHKAIPPLFSKEAEVLHRPEAMKATDWGSEGSKTLVSRYGPATKPFHVGLRKLAKELLERLGRSSGRDKLSVVANLRRKLRDFWRS
ncbi:ParA family protein [Prosthecobacter sp.]|uniref:ParA family protein n=1 Tax=Prosthecobacter sp. TaxID=1965333 RepID=UPI00378361E5